MTVVTPPTPGTNCNIQPEEQTISIYKLSLCTAKPSAPTVSISTALTNCNVIFTSTSSTGSLVSIALNATAALPNGTVAKPANGTYTHLYLEIDPEVKIKSTVKFASTMGDSNGVTSGVYCWTKPVSTYTFATNVSGSLPQATTCNTNLPTASDVAASTSIFNSLSDDSGPPLNGTGFINSFINLPTTAGGLATLDAYLIDANGKLVTTQVVNTIGTVSRVAAILTLPGSGVTVTDSSSSFVLGYNNTKGAQIATQSGVTPSRLSKIGNGPFDMTVTFP